MSTATRTEPKAARWITGEIPNMVSLSPAPCRMIAVEVFEHEGDKHTVDWSAVVGFLCVIRTRYMARSTAVVPEAGANHDEMEDRGWESVGGPEYDVFPVVTGGEFGLISVLNGDSLDSCNNRLYRCVVPCNWPQDEDRENAIRIGNQMLKQDHHIMSGHAPLD